MNPVHFSSKTAEWSTPPDFFAKVEAEFGPFDLDPCATRENAKAPRWYDRQEDGLSRHWEGKVWINPPYGREIGAWVRGAATTGCWGPHLKGFNDHGHPDLTLIVMLLPARTDTKWWHDYVIPYASEIRFIKGRLKFGGAKNSAPFPSALVVFRRLTSETK